MTSDAALDAMAAGWWDRHFSAFGDRIPFKSLFFPLLLQACEDVSGSRDNNSEELSQDTLATLVRHCVAENAWIHNFVTKRDVRTPVALHNLSDAVRSAMGTDCRFL